MFVRCQAVIRPTHAMLRCTVTTCPQTIENALWPRDAGVVFLFICAYANASWRTREDRGTRSVAGAIPTQFPGLRSEKKQRSWPYSLHIQL